MVRGSHYVGLDGEVGMGKGPETYRKNVSSRNPRHFSQEQTGPKQPTQEYKRMQGLAQAQSPNQDLTLEI